MPELLASFEVFAFPSRFEGLCVSVIEAQAAGVPVVATPVGGIRETVVEGETGWLVPPGDAVALAERISWVLDHPTEARPVADEALRRARERFSIDKMVERTLALYASARDPVEPVAVVLVDRAERVGRVFVAAKHCVVPVERPAEPKLGRGRRHRRARVC